MSYNPFSICFYTQIVPKLAHENLFRLAFVYPFDIFSIFEFCVTVWYNKMFGLLNSLYLPQPHNQSFLWEPFIFLFLILSGKQYLEAKVWARGVLFATRMSLLPDSMQWTRPGNTCSCMQYTYLIHTNITICIYFCIYLCILKTMYSHQHLQVLSSFTRFVLIFTLSMFITPLILPSVFFTYFMQLCPSVQSTLDRCSDVLGHLDLGWLPAHTWAFDAHTGLLHTWLLHSSPCSDLSPCSGPPWLSSLPVMDVYLVILHLKVLGLNCSVREGEEEDLNLKEVGRPWRKTFK